ncbi:MAG: glucose-6-phosphate dehydrogenase, partial [Rhodospirillaceae bacterium]
MVARTVEVDPFDLVVFGGTGDLSRRKLLPALYHRDRAGQIPDDARIIGVARSDLSTGAYREEAEMALREFVSKTDLEPAALERFLNRLDYAPADLKDKDGEWTAL